MVEQPKANRGLQQLSEARVDMVDIFNVAVGSGAHQPEVQILAVNGFMGMA